MNVDLDYLTDHRSDPDTRMVLDDLTRQSGATRTRIGAALWIAYADADANADADAYAYAYAYADADANANADADAYAYAYADAYAYAYAYADADATRIRFLLEEPDMREGLVLIKTPGYYGGPTRIGWLRRVAGDHYELLPGFRSVSRESGDRELAIVAADGPKKDHKLGEPSRVAEDIHALLVWRCVQADPEAWAKTVPMPKDWKAGGS